MTIKNGLGKAPWGSLAFLLACRQLTFVCSLFWNCLSVLSCAYSIKFCNVPKDRRDPQSFVLHSKLDSGGRVYAHRFSASSFSLIPPCEKVGSSTLLYLLPPEASLGLHACVTPLLPTDSFYLFFPQDSERQRFNHHPCAWQSVHSTRWAMSQSWGASLLLLLLFPLSPGVFFEAQSTQLPFLV